MALPHESSASRTTRRATQGRENAVVLVHAGGSNPQSMAPFANHIQPDLDCVGLPLLGHAGRPIPAGYTLDEMADDLVANIQRTGLIKPFIFGYCFGSVVLLNILTRYSGLFKGAALLGPRWHFNESAISHYSYLVSDAYLLRKGSPLAKELEERQGPRWLEVARNQRRLFESMREQRPVDPARFAAIDCPVLIIGATKDPLTTFAEAQDLANRIPKSVLIRLEGPAHPPLALPYEDIAQQLVRFFRNNI